MVQKYCRLLKEGFTTIAGDLTQILEKYESKWESSPNRVLKLTCFETTTYNYKMRFVVQPVSTRISFILLMDAKKPCKPRDKPPYLNCCRISSINSITWNPKQPFINGCLVKQTLSI